MKTPSGAAAPAHPERYADLLVGLSPEAADATMAEVYERLNLDSTQPAKRGALRSKRVLLIVHRINPFEDFDVPEQKIMRGVGREKLRSIKSGKRVTLQ